MFPNSVIRKTGQWWKLVIGVVAMLAGSILPIFESSGVSMTTGTIVAIVGYGFSMAAILCPSCHQRWFWKALLHAEMYVPLFKKSQCPNCEQEF